MSIVWSEEIAKDTAETLLDSNVYSINFSQDKSEWTKLPDGTITPCYCNCRYINRTPYQSRAVVSYLETMVRVQYKKAGIIVGLATAGIPFASLLADRLGLPVSYVRNKPKGYGQGNLVECNPQRELKAVVIDDLLFTGASMVRSVEALSCEYGITTIGVATIVALSSWESQENEWKFFKERDIAVHSLTSYHHLLDELLRRDKIVKSQFQQLSAYYLCPKSYEWQ